MPLSLQNRASDNKDAYARLVLNILADFGTNYDACDAYRHSSYTLSSLRNDARVHFLALLVSFTRHIHIVQQDQRQYRPTFLESSVLVFHQFPRSPQCT